MSDTDPIRAMAAVRRPATYRLPEYARPRLDDAPAVNLHGLTPGAGLSVEPTPAERFARFLRDQRDGAYGA